MESFNYHRKGGIDIALRRSYSAVKHRRPLSLDLVGGAILQWVYAHDMGVHRGW